MASRKRAITSKSNRTRLLWDDFESNAEVAQAEPESPKEVWTGPSPFSNLVIRASAGTGKTFQLSNRYLALLDRGVPADRILATTFTRKAAGEILERIILRLATAVDDSQQRQALGHFIGNERLSRHRCLELLQQLLRQLHRLRIGTLDSLFGQIARAFSLEIGLPAGWRIVDELQELSLRDAAIDAVLQQETTTELVRLAHLLTKGETRRSVAQLMRETVQELHTLFQETDAAAWHSIPKFKLLKDSELEELLARLEQVTFADRRMKTACEKDLQNAVAGDWDSLISKGLASKCLAGETTYFCKDIPDDALGLYRQLLGHARAILVNRLALQTEGSYELLHKYDSARGWLQRDLGGVRFDDITQRLDRALRQDRDSAGGVGGTRVQADGQLAYRLDGNIGHVLLDEFQDTAPKQWRVLRPFVDRAARLDGKSSFFCVGDVKQAIYGWRGGVAQIFDALEKHVPNITQLQLAQSFRSSAPVIEAVNRVFQGLHQHTNLEGAETAVRTWQKQFEVHSTAKSDLPGYACLCTAPAAEDGVPAQDSVLQHAAGMIRELTRSAPTCDIGVLVRKNATVTAMIHALRSQGIEASEEGGNPLVDSAAVQLILSLLRIADHPSDTVARFHVANSPLAHSFNYSDHQDDLAARRLSLHVRNQLLVDGYGRAIQQWCGGLLGQVTSRDATRLEQLVELAYLYQSQSTLRTDDFVKHVQTKRVMDPSPASVRVMTVHQSKGLEFDIVILPELDFAVSGQPPPFVVERPDPTAPVSRVCRYANSQTRQLLPNTLQSLFDDYVLQEVAESLCVLYVALTRAAHALYMVIAPSKENERTLPRTFAGLLRASLSDGKSAGPACILFEVGDRNWVTSLVPRGAATSDEKEREIKPIGTIRLAATEQRTRGLTRISPSGLEGGEFLRLPTAIEKADDSAALRGTVIHAWFETIRWLEDESLDDKELLTIAEDLLRGLGAAADCNRLLREFRAMLEAPAIQQQLRKGEYRLEPGVTLSVETERPFAVAEQGGLLTGCIDRLVLKSDSHRILSAEIIDYKTDQLSASDQTGWNARVEYYRPQMEAYRRAVVTLAELPLDRISARLVFVSSGRVVELN